jgi:5-methylcytosine-specific restriction endonuclease McrA
MERKRNSHFGRQPKSVYNARYRSKHPDRVKASQRKYAQKDIDAHRKRCREATARYRAKDPERARRKAKEWRDNNREKVKQIREDHRKRSPERTALQSKLDKQKRRARKLNSGGSHTAEDIVEILRMQRRKCAYCRVKVGKSYHVDHIVALARNGSNDKSNIQVLCAGCNHKKHATDPIDFVRETFGMLL